MIYWFLRLYIFRYVCSHYFILVNLNPAKKQQKVTICSEMKKVSFVNTGPDVSLSLELTGNLNKNVFYNVEKFEQ
jgi:hypothetical protein